MKSPKKMSRNRTRKAAYRAQADSSSRNEYTLDAPVIGRMEWVTRDEAGKVLARPYQRIVHDGDGVDAASPNATPYIKRETDARKVRRQLAAWGRCRSHDMRGANCHSCGAPVSHVTAQAVAA